MKRGQIWEHSSIAQAIARALFSAFPSAVYPRV